MAALDQEMSVFASASWLEEAARLLSAAASVDEVTAILVGEVADLLGANAAFVAFRDGDAVSLHRRRGLPIRSGIWNRFALDSPVPAAEAIRLGRPVWAETRAELREGHPLLARHLPSRSFFAQPVGGKVPAGGVVGFGWREERRFARSFRERLGRLAAEAEEALGRVGFDPSELSPSGGGQRRQRGAGGTTGAFIAHDMRNYLNAMRLHLEMLAPRAGRQATAGLERCVQGLARLADDVADLPSPESVPVRLSLEELDPATFLEEVCERGAPMAREAGVELRCEATGELPAVRADPDRLWEVLDNLLINAIRYTSAAGRISVDAEVLEGNVVFAVIDTGSGIPPDDVGRIFEPYWRAEDSAGEGIGLAIARAIVMAHGGRIWVVSEPGEGTGLFFSLPLPPAAQEVEGR